MNFKPILPLLLLFTINLFSKENIIATNHDKSIVLTEEKLNNWLSLNKPYKLHQKESQINSYFLEKALLQKKNLISDLKMLEIEFNHTNLLYRSSFAIYKKEVVSNIEMDKEQYEEMLQQSIQKNQAKRDKVRLYQIFKRYPISADALEKKKVLKEMETIRNSISDLESFKKIAQFESDSQSRLRNGLIGNVHHGLFPKELNDIVMKMQAGELSEILKSPDGLMLFYCETIVPAHRFSIEELEKSVKNAIISHKTKVEWSQFNNEIVEELDIFINFPALSKLKNDAIFAKTGEAELTIQQVKWLLNNNNLSQVDKKNITSIINHYFVSQHLFNNLRKEKQDELRNKIHQLYINSITSAVTFELMDGKFVSPNHDQLLSYYNKNNNEFIRLRHFDVSYIAFDLKDQVKDYVYNIAKSVLEFLKENPEQFNHYSTKQKIKNVKIKASRSHSVPENKLANYFGLNVTKQLHLLKPNEISKLVESDSGILWIMRLNSIEPNRPMTFNEAKAQIDKIVGNRLLSELENKIINDILEHQKILIVNRET